VAETVAKAKAPVRRAAAPKGKAGKP